MTARDDYPLVASAAWPHEWASENNRALDEIDLLRRLLPKYIRHVADCEGATFIVGYRNVSDVEFTDEEWAALEEIGAEL